MAVASSEYGERIGPGRVVLVVGPSGAGKDTLIGIACTKLDAQAGRRHDVRFPKRFVTRAATAAEDNLVMSGTEFDEAIAHNRFALHWRAHGVGYGIGADIDRAIESGATVVINVSREVVAMARRRYAHVGVVYVDAPASVRAQRIAQRGRESAAGMQSRLQQASSAFSFNEADIVIVNDREPEAAGQCLYDFVTATTAC